MSRVYLAIDRTGEPVLVRLRKYLMKYAIEEYEKRGLNTDSYTYWSVPTVNRLETYQVTKSFFKDKNGTEESD